MINKQLNNKLTFPQKLKVDFLLPYLKKNHKILDLGCGSMWLTYLLKSLGYNCLGFSIDPPADIIGNVKTYRFKKNEFDIVIALEMLEHVDCLKEIRHILKPGGLLIVTTPAPHGDFICLLGEKLGIFQNRQTPHCNLIYLKEIPFTPIKTKIILGIFQFGVFKK